MPRKIQDVTKDYLVNVPLPVHGNTYTVISHQSIIDYAYAELANHGFGIVKEEYRCTQDGQIAQGIYRLHHQSDPELALMFAWTNSYNKQIKFKCATGAYVDANGTVMLGGEVGSYTRKHTGTADADTIASMQAQITNAQMYYNMLAQDKDIMKGIPLTKKKQAELLGVLFADHEVLTTEQASIIRQQMTKPTYFYNGGKDTLWAFYNHVTVAFQNSHPRTWMEDQRILHWFISNEFDLSTPVTLVNIPPLDLTTPVDPLLNNYGQPENQTNLLVQIAEIEESQETVVLDIPEGTEIVEKEVLMSAEVVVMDLSDPESTPEPLQDYVERTAVEEVDHVIVEDEIWTTDEEPQKIATILDEVVHYTDPAGNTFEAPVVEDKEPEVAPHRVKFAIDEVEEVVPTLEPSPEDYALVEKEDSVVDDAGFDFDLELNEEKQVDDDDDFDFFI